MSEIEFSEVKEGESPSSPIKVTDDNFEEFSKRFPVALLDFWAPWCGPCMRIGPIIEELAGEMKGKVAFGKLNTDENPNVARKFMIQAIPTMIIFKNGEVADQVVGLLPKHKLISKLEEHI